LKLLDRVVGQGGQPRRVTPGADTQYQEGAFIQALRKRKVAPHLIEFGEDNRGKNSRTDEGRVLSQRQHKLTKRVFDWSKLDRPLRQMKLRGLARVDWLYRLTTSLFPQPAIQFDKPLATEWAFARSFRARITQGNDGKPVSIWALRV